MQKPTNKRIDRAEGKIIMALAALLSVLAILFSHQETCWGFNSRDCELQNRHYLTSAFLFSDSRSSGMDLRAILAIMILVGSYGFLRHESIVGRVFGDNEKKMLSKIAERVADSTDNGRK